LTISTRRSETEFILLDANNAITPSTENALAHHIKNEQSSYAIAPKAEANGVAFHFP
jgi:hypothetical protein